MMVKKVHPWDMPELSEMVSTVDKGYPITITVTGEDGDSLYQVELHHRGKACGNCSIEFPHCPCSICVMNREDRGEQYTYYDKY